MAGSSIRNSASAAIQVDESGGAVVEFGMREKVNHYE
jgi:hypothetical protein